MIKYNSKAELELNKTEAKQIKALLSQCFPGYPDRTFIKQIPHHRILAKDGRKICGHIALEHRIIQVGKETFTILGVADVCVDPEKQNLQIATKMLKKAESLASKKEIDFLLLSTDNLPFYKKLGFSLIENKCNWLLLQNNQSYGIVSRRLENTLMKKSVSGKKWNRGDLDFLGHIF